MYDRYAQLLNAIEVDALRDLGHVVVRSERFFLRPSVLHRILRVRSLDRLACS